MLILFLFAPIGVRAAENVGDATATVSPVPPKHHHTHKKKASISATSNGTVAPTPGTGSNQKTAATNTDAPGMSDSLGSNNPGTPNMGAPDHVPGTTGTSGQ
jgi:hypothetical protein